MQAQATLIFGWPDIFFFLLLLSSIVVAAVGVGVADVNVADAAHIYVTIIWLKEKKIKFPSYTTIAHTSLWWNRMTFNNSFQYFFISIVLLTFSYEHT